MRGILRSAPGIGLSVVIGGALAIGAEALASPPACVGLSVADGTKGAARNGKGVFSATSVVDLVVQAHMGPGLDGEHILEFQFFTPDKHLYQSMSFPVADPKSGVLKHRSVPGYPWPMKESAAQAEPGRGSFKIERNFPVGGTQIVGYGLYGTWTVQANLDGSQVPACPAATFGITP